MTPPSRSRMLPKECRELLELQAKTHALVTRFQSLTITSLITVLGGLIGMKLYGAI